MVTANSTGTKMVAPSLRKVKVFMTPEMPLAITHREISTGMNRLMVKGIRISAAPTTSQMMPFTKYWGCTSYFRREA